MQQDQSWDAADSTVVWLFCWMHSETEGAGTHPRRHPLAGAQAWVPRGGTFSPCRADGRTCLQVQPVACENSEDRSITRVDEGLEDFFSKRLIPEELL